MRAKPRDHCRECDQPVATVTGTLCKFHLRQAIVQRNKKTQRTRKQNAKARRLDSASAAG